MGVELFVDEGGYTTVAVATALLVSLSMVFCVASAQWTLSRSADLQEVADASSVAASNAVSSFYAMAQVADACVLSLGLTGFAVMGAGLVAAAIPGKQGMSDELLRRGSELLDARNRFACNAAKGLRDLEGMLPGIVASRSWSCSRANSSGGLAYRGVAMPYPMASQSDYSALLRGVEGADVLDAARRLQEATRESEEARRRADESCARAWTADCVDAPRCMLSRARDLAGLVGTQNPYAASPETWTFGVAIRRTRAYYAARLSRESPSSDDIVEVTNSACREAFYRYALDEANAAWYTEGPGGTVDLHVPHLARNPSEVRETWLYDEARWPCTEESGRIVLHSALSCPGATGPAAGFQSVAAIDRGEVGRCDVCAMDVSDLGAVASISTSASNGYEHYWQIVVEEAMSFKQARDELAEAESKARQVADEGKRAFERAIDRLRGSRPRVCPPGACGCVSVAYRNGGAAVPSELTKAFLGEADLGAGVAVSASALAVDEDASDGGVLTHIVDVAKRTEGLGAGSVPDGIAELWGRLLVSCGSAYGDVGDVAREYLIRLDGVSGGSVGAWLRDGVASVLGNLRLSLPDMRMRKPVLAHTSEVMGMAGAGQLSQVRTLMEAISSDGSIEGVARRLGAFSIDGDARSFTIAELPIPGTHGSMPLTVDLVAAGGGL